jgi:O-acetyl-ADP-ribose deacetylase (regulator of RNase III)
MSPQIILIQDDITTLRVDAIVNAANTTLLGGGGVDGAIHRAAGPALREETASLGGCAVGQAKLTSGHNLQAAHIIHTVGPYYGQAHGKEIVLLRSCYLESLYIAGTHHFKSIAFPCISTGAFQYPKDEAAQIAIETVSTFLHHATHYLEEIYFVTVHDIDFDIYSALLSQT